MKKLIFKLLWGIPIKGEPVSSIKTGVKTTNYQTKDFNDWSKVLERQ